LKTTSLSLPSAAVALLAAAVLAVTTVAQAPQPAAGGPPPSPPQGRTAPAPTNLKVLPKTLTGDQVHEIMERWEGALGAHCNTCHTADPNKAGPNGRPQLNFADDSKQEKATARLMFTMTEELNKNYVSKIPIKAEAPAPAVSCGTCHRGHLEPEPFVAPAEDRSRPPQGPPPAGAMPPPPQ
jgi:cytochrome c553